MIDPITSNFSALGSAHAENNFLLKRRQPWGASGARVANALQLAPRPRRAQGPCPLGPVRGWLAEPTSEHTCTMLATPARCIVVAVASRGACGLFPGGQ